MDTINRFSSKVENYIRYRWNYSSHAIAFLLGEIQLTHGGRMADIGAGPGTLTQHFLDAVTKVYGIEPNPEMRRLAQEILGDHPNLELIDAHADAIPLPDHSIDLITAGRAIHWFPLQSTVNEFRRILVPGGWLALFNVSYKNEALKEATDQLKTHQYGWEMTPGLDQIYKQDISHYFYNQEFSIHEFPHTITESFADFLGRFLSLSRSPDPTDPIYPKFEEAAKQVFDHFSQEGRLEIELVTRVKLGRVTQNA